MSGKRADGEGGITQRKDGLWQASWTETVDGQRKRRYVYGRTRKDAADKLRDKLQHVANGQPSVEARDTFQTVAERWRQTARIRQGIKINSLQNYSSALRLHVYPVIGGMAVRDIKPSDIARVLAAMEDKGLSASYRNTAHKAMSGVFTMAVDDGMLRNNPTRKVKVARPAPSTKVVPDRATVTALIEAAPDAVYRCLIAVMANTGLRIGEAINLRWGDIKGGTLTVRDGKGSKSRAVPVTRGLDAELSRWRKAQAAQRLAAPWWDESEDWVLTNGIGRRLDQRNTNRMFKRLADGVPATDDTPAAEGVCPGATPHSMRHACATLLLEEGVPMKVVSEVLGHSSTRVTADIYSHVTARLLGDARDAIDRALGGA